MTVGRNEPCHCGSGKKYKNCCIRERRSSRGLVILGAALLALAAAGVMTMAGDKKAPAPPTAAQRAYQTGAAPPGKVWSAEHGHWHDAAPARPATPGLPPGQATSVPPGQTKPGSPQPPGPAPAGQVWSTEHGHWHDASK
jgi:hypothetical protein